METGSDPSFDRAAYEDRVVRPLRGRPGAVPARRVEMYALDPGMSGPGIAARLASVRACWAELRDRGGHLGSVGATLLAADAELAAVAGEAMLDPAWWGAADVPGPPPDPAERTEPRLRAVLPTAAACDVVVTPHGTGVRLTWTPAGDAVHHVLRATGRVPTALDDGEVVAGPGGAEAFDPAPPVGVAVGYAVLAVAPGCTPSPPVGGLLTVVPPVADVVVTGEPGAVRLRWSQHPDTAGVEVRRRSPGGVAEVAVTATGTARDEPADGVEHEYALTARYVVLGAEGHGAEGHGADGPGVEVRADPVVVRGATRPEAVPVADLSAGPAAGDRGTTVAVGWSQAVGAEVEVRRSAQPCPWAYGAVVADPAAAGERLDGARTAGEDRTVLVTELPAGPWYLTAFTRGADGWLRGGDVRVDVVPPVSGLDARRQGAEVLLSWVWPAGIALADVRWSGSSEVLRVLRGRYVGDGGVRLRPGPGPERIEVSAVRRDADGSEASALPASVTLPAVRTPVPWTAERRRDRWRRTEHLTVRVSCAVDLTCTVALTATPGVVLPVEHRPEAELHRAEITLRAGEPIDLVTDLPLPRLPRPYWLRLFVLDPPTARPQDPPVHRMKVT